MTASGGRPAASTSLARRSTASPYWSTLEEERHPAVGPVGGPPQCGLGRAADPHRDGVGGGQLQVALGRVRRAGVAVGGAVPGPPRPVELADRRVEVVAARVVGRTDLLVLAGMAPHAHAEDQPAPAEGLEGGRLLGHRHRPPEGELDHAGAERGPLGDRGGHGQDDEALEARAVPEQVVAGPQGVGAGLLGPTAQVGQLGQGVGVGRGPRRPARPSPARCAARTSGGSGRWARGWQWVVPGAHRMVPPRPRDRGRSPVAASGRSGAVSDGRTAAMYEVGAGTAEWGRRIDAIRPCRSPWTGGRTTDVDTDEQRHCQRRHDDRDRRRRPRLTDEERGARLAALNSIIELMRPAVQADGGDLALISADVVTGVVEVQLQGACSSCAISSSTLQGGVERILHDRLDWVTEVDRRRRRLGRPVRERVDGPRRLRPELLTTPTRVDGRSAHAAPGRCRYDPGRRGPSDRRSGPVSPTDRPPVALPGAARGAATHGAGLGPPTPPPRSASVGPLAHRPGLRRGGGRRSPCRRRCLATAPSAHLTLPDDLALIDLHTRRALAWKQQLGVFDHNNWNHPGPTYFYLAVPRLPGARLGRPGPVRRRHRAQRTGRRGLRGGGAPAHDPGPGAVGGAVGLRRSAIVLAAAGPSATTYSESVLGALVSPWNPMVVLFPLLLLVLLCAGAVDRSGLSLVGALLVGSFVVQTDISTAPLVVALVVAAAVTWCGSWTVDGHAAPGRPAPGRAGAAWGIGPGGRRWWSACRAACGSRR